MKIRFPIRLKLFLLLSGLTVLVLSAVLFAVNTISTKTISEDVFTDFANLQEVFKVQQDLRYKTLITSAILVAENPAFKANVELKDESSVYFSVLEFSAFVESELLIVTDDIGNVLAWFGRQDLHGMNLSELPQVGDALEGYYPEFEPEWPQIWAFEGNLYQVVSIPILKAGDIVIGTLTFANRFTDAEAIDLKQNTGIEISMFFGQDLIAASNPEIESEDFWPFLLDNPTLVDSITTNLILSETFNSKVWDQDMLLAVSPLGIGESAFFIATIPVSAEFSTLQLIQENIIVIAGVSIFFIIV
ncbi:MAG: hypothetical protein MI700_03775, partial [Balneolales bacterium]|nr:hypothetical protein [Balneolales bacterium]